MITLGLLFPFIGNIILLTVTGGWNKDPEDEEEEVEEESKDVKSEVSTNDKLFKIKLLFNLRKERRKV